MTREQKGMARCIKQEATEFRNEISKKLAEKVKAKLFVV